MRHFRIRTASLSAFIAVALIAGCKHSTETTAPAQVAPDAHWRTISTTHFHIHFTPELEATARRAAVDTCSSCLSPFMAAANRCRTVPVKVGSRRMSRRTTSTDRRSTSV